MASRDNCIRILPEYSHIINLIKQKCPAIFVTGKAGTGKSEMVKYLSHAFKNSVVVAPTGIAAFNIDGETIHSFFNLPLNFIIPYCKSIPYLSLKKESLLNELSVLIIDEVSMLLPNVVDRIDTFLKKIRKEFKPFGGVSVVFVGDLFQLPPILDGEYKEDFYNKYKYETEYFFSAKIFDQIKLFPLELTNIFRQKDREFINALNAIRVGNTSNEILDLINRQYHSEYQPKYEDICIFIKNDKCNYLNKNQLDKLPGKEIIYNSETRYYKYYNSIEDYKVIELQDINKYPSTKKDKKTLDKFLKNNYKSIAIKKDARVVFIKNNHNYWKNGQLGTVVDFNDSNISVQLDDTNAIVLVERISINEEFEYKYVINKDKTDKTRDFINIRIEIKNFPIALGWAITVHKSQGLTLNKVNICLENSFCTGQAYVALSRNKTLSGIRLLSKLQPYNIKVDNRISDFYDKLFNYR